MRRVSLEEKTVITVTSPVILFLSSPYSSLIYIFHYCQLVVHLLEENDLDRVIIETFLQPKSII